jgi:hypothetical protein
MPTSTRYASSTVVGAVLSPLVCDDSLAASVVVTSTSVVVSSATLVDPPDDDSIPVEPTSPDVSLPASLPDDDPHPDAKIGSEISSDGNGNR